MVVSYLNTKSRKPRMKALKLGCIKKKSLLLNETLDNSARSGNQPDLILLQFQND